MISAYASIRYFNLLLSSIFASLGVVASIRGTVATPKGILRKMQPIFWNLNLRQALLPFQEPPGVAEKQLGFHHPEHDFFSSRTISNSLLSTDFKTPKAEPSAADSDFETSTQAEVCLMLDYYICSVVGHIRTFLNLLVNQLPLQSFVRFTHGFIYWRLILGPRSRPGPRLRRVPGI
ncbi:MAG: hypothetical protein EZS28_022909 [Streblomastix strix]|uniref:Uncharacterized protein n=1 Tax=Streblomastix strix TaxID=222440 RepID=A0A5J4VGR2_9EUKA|nr:MAG: hypothetical protein EZS28_022909 [Streblomastix strix]